MLRFLTLLFATLCFAEIPTTLPDISGSGNVTQASTTSKPAHWIVFISPSSNTSSTYPRIGDSSISSSQGIPLAPGGSFYIGPTNLNTTDHNLQNWYYLIQSGDKLIIEYGQ